jgi:hypothetical protein
MRLLRRSLVLAGALLGWWATAIVAQLAPIELSCSPATPIVSLPGRVAVRAWTDRSDALTFRWTATTGDIDRTGREVTWRIDRVSPETPVPFRATVRADGPGGRSGTCTMDVWPPATGRGPAQREAARTLLTGGAAVPEGYGLYSYLVFGSLPTDSSRERYMAALDAWWSLLPDLVQLEKYVGKAQLNAMFFPVAASPPATVTGRQRATRGRRLCSTSEENRPPSQSSVPSETRKKRIEWHADVALHHSRPCHRRVPAADCADP